MGIADETYVLLTTFRRNGDAVPTPVWIVGLPDGSAGFTTELDSGKVKRIRNNPKVTLQPCDMRGKVKEGSAVVEATAEVLVGEAAHPIRDAIRNRHKLMTSMFKVTDLFRRVVLRKNPAECAIRIVL
ncbi:MAG TPA: PPOX class F420-dependent oxidoreductase [Acidimicrobiaceae bacterium]|nr:PPOX class F420-dependent oxidoreductase [Acidimicrobiaceae bacterium]